MNQLVPISGYAKTFTELCNIPAESGEFYNVLDQTPFQTYLRTDDTEIGDTMRVTDICGWFPNKAEMESNAKAGQGDIFITGEIAPYTRWKAVYTNGQLHWEEDGETDLKVLKHYDTELSLKRKLASIKNNIEPDEYYAVGKELPWKVYGQVYSWEPVGAFISYTVDNIKQLINKPVKSNPGEIAFLDGMFYVYTGDGWDPIQIIEPVQNVYKHTYMDGERQYRLRESLKVGYLEFFTPRELM